MIKVTRSEIPEVLVDKATNWTNEYLEAKEVYSQQNTKEEKKAAKKKSRKYREKI